MRHITIVAANYRPETGAAAQRIVSIAEELVRRGWGVTIVTQLPHYPQNHIYPAYDLPSPHFSDEAGVMVIRLRPWIVPRESLLLRTLSELFFCLQALPHLLRAPTSILMASSPYMFLGPLGLFVSRIRRKTFVWDVRDLTWLYPRATGKRTFGLDKPVEQFMLWVAHRTDALTTATEGLMNYFSRRPTPSIVLANGVSDPWLERLIALRPTADADDPVVLYAGLFGYNHGLSTVVEAARLLPDITFVLAGDGPERRSLEERVHQDGLTNVEFMGYLNEKQLIEAYQESTVLVSHVRRNELYRWTQPAKLWEYMATGRPVIHAGEGEIIDILKAHSIAITVPPEQPEAMASAVHQLLANPETSIAMGQRGRDFVIRHRKRSVLLEQFVGVLDRLTTTKGQTK